MQAVAQGWLVLQLSNSPLWLGVDGFMATAPGLVFTLARAIGPVFAGVGFKLFGLPGCFIANGISFVFVVIAMLLVKFDRPEANDAAPARSVKQKGVFVGDLIAGFRYVAGRPRVLMLL